MKNDIATPFGTVKHIFLITHWHVAVLYHIQRRVIGPAALTAAGTARLATGPQTSRKLLEHFYHIKKEITCEMATQGPQENILQVAARTQNTALDINLGLVYATADEADA